MKATTTIIDDLNIPEESGKVMAREAMRREIPVNLLAKEWLLEKADRIIAAAQGGQKAKAHA